MSKENKLIPELRFPEFVKEGEWQIDIVDNLVSTITPPRKLSSSNYQKSGEFPIIDQSKNFYCGWTNDVNAVITDNLPLIIFGDHTCILKIVNEPFVQGADGIKILKTNSKISPELLYQYLQYDEVKQEDYKRHFSILKEKNVLFPNKESGEQQKIASCLSSLDEVITAHSQTLELLKDHKKGLMQNLFPQKGEEVPKYRFSEFKKDGDWVEKKLEEIAIFVNEKTPLENLSVKTYISTENLLSDYAGVISASKLPGSGNFTKYRKGDVLISNIRPYLKKVWFSDKEGACSNDVLVVRAASEINEVFLSFLLRNDDFINYVMTGAKGVKMPRGDKDLISKYPISFPKRRAEQQKIASCLFSLDELITAQAQKIEQLKLHKKGLMQGLFPKMKD